MVNEDGGMDNFKDEQYFWQLFLALNWHNLIDVLLYISANVFLKQFCFINGIPQQLYLSA